jgi:hypothetical protein
MNHSSTVGISFSYIMPAITYEGRNMYKTLSHRSLCPSGEV